jgi:cytochrome c551/c552
MFTKPFPVFSFLAAALLMSACSVDTPKSDNKSKKATVSLGTDHSAALRLMQSNCASCHKLGPAGDGPVIAPGMGDIRDAYMDAFPEREDFVKAATAFSKNPTKEAALMKQAVSKNGLMPKLGVAESDLKAISEYLYENEVGTEVWLRSLKAESDAPESEEGLSYLERGRKYALSTKQALGSKLMAAVQEFGPAGAVDFCNIHAMPITDSISTIHAATIRRVSDRPRNPANRANAEEAAYIEALKSAKSKGEELPPLISEKGTSVTAYYAIETNDMCLKCHGSGDIHVAPETQKAIAERYPDDQAIGYDVNQIRGLFVVEMAP